jgi:beta-glucanase (GH16 family)
MKDGELDIMEHYGNIPGQIESTAHSFLHSREVHVDVPDYSTNFHTYGVELRPTDIRWTLDGTEYGRVEKQSDDPDEWPFGNGNKMYVILNLAMGGGMKSNYIDRSHRRAWRLIVRDVRFYEYEGAA